MSHRLSYRRGLGPERRIGVLITSLLLALLSACGVDDGGAPPELEAVDTLEQELAVSEWPVQALVATNSIHFEDRARFTGDVVARDRVSGAVLSSNAELTLGSNVVVTGNVKADTLVANGGSRVTGNAQYNARSGSGTQGSVTTPLPTPVPVSVPTLPTIQPGSQSITLSNSQQRTLSAGSYGAVTLNSGNGGIATRLTLGGGTYQIASLNVGNDARVECSAACEIRVNGRVNVGNRAYVGPAPGVAGLGSGNVQLLVKGTNGSSGPLGSPPAVLIADTSQLHAYTFAPNGTLRLGHRVSFRGKLVARDVAVGFDTVAEGRQLALVSSQPTDVSVREGQQANFSVTASGASLSYQWQRNGSNIPGATSASYTTPPTVRAADDGAQFRVVITSDAGTVISSSARLSVSQCASEDLTCDGQDDDCDGAVDEDYVAACAGTALVLCVSGAPVSHECVDADVCNGQESCSAGACQPGEPVFDDGSNGCAPPPTCEPGSWDHDANMGTACVLHSVCAPGEYVAEEGSPTTDRQCVACPSGTFSLVQDAVVCLPFVECTPGQFVLVDGSSSSDRICAGCASGTYSTVANALSCTDWTTCESGSYVTSAPSAVADRECAACAEGTYSPSPNLDACLEAGECPAGTVQTAPATGTSPPACASCAAGTHCAGGTAPQLECGAGDYDDDGDSATPCVAMTNCIAGEYVATAGDALADRTCSACPADSFSDEQNAASCTAWTTCAATEFESEPGSATEDRVCEAIGVVQVVASGNHTCARRNDGKVRCWGLGAEGRLGYGDGVTYPEPAGDVPGLGFVTQLVSGRQYTCALMDTGSVRCWGSGANGRLGYGNTSDVLAPSQDVPVGTSVQQVAAGNAHMCVLTDEGGVRCWGFGLYGQLGMGGTPGSIADESSPPATDVDFDGEVAVEIAAGLGHTCARMQSGGVRCFGDNGNGFTFLGYGDAPTPHTTPGPNLTFPAASAPLRIFASHGPPTCALFDGGALRCWGRSPSGMLGYDSMIAVGDIPSRPIANDINLGAGVAQVSIGREHSCALLVDGTVKCWGRGLFGALGNGSTANVSDGIGLSIAVAPPVDFGELGEGVSVVQVSAGGDASGSHSCAVLSDGNVRCWGRSDQGQLGYVPLAHRSTPGPNVAGLIP